MDQEVQTTKEMMPTVVDIGINLTNKAFRKHWKEVVQRAIDAGVSTMLLTGTSIRTSRESLAMAQEWYEFSGSPNLYTTIGIHPHDAKTWNDETTISELKEMLKHPLAVAVGECGLDFNRNFSSKQDQLHAFREQLNLACELKKPMFVHEREGHSDLIQVLDEVGAEHELPPIVVHCFTGTKEEATEYIQRGYYIGFTGTIVKKERGAPLRELLPHLPIERIMVETDAPWMGFKKGRRISEPADCVDVARKLAESIDLPFLTVCEITTKNALDFFGIQQ